MRPNMNPQTGIRYGVINANNVDADIIDDFQAHYETLYCSNCGEALTDIYCDGCETKNPEYEQQEPHHIWTLDAYGVKAEFNTDTNIIMVFESPTTKMCRLCSPCYPNAGDLDSPDDEGYETYAL